MEVLDSFGTVIKGPQLLQKLKETLAPDAARSRQYHIGLPQTQTRRAQPALRRTGFVIDLLVTKSKRPRSGGPFSFKETAKGAIRRIRVLMEVEAPRRPSGPAQAVRPLLPPGSGRAWT